MNRRTLLAVATLALMAMAGLLWLRSTAPAADTPAETPAPAPTAAAWPAPSKASVAALSAVALSAADQEFITALRSKFAGAIQGKHAQIKLIEQLIAYLMEHYPDDWQGRVQEFLRQLFPELADALYAKFEKLLGYNDWLRTRRQELMQLPPQERRQALWDARRAAFGSDADEIWQAEIRNEKVVATLAELDQLQGADPEQKFSRLLDSIREAYGEQAEHFIASSQSELLGRFLSLPSVQADLNAMPRPAQHATLRRVRTAAGLDEPALQRWDQLDATRDQAWDAGQSYQVQREAIIARYTGTEQSSRLTALQDQTFGAEAETIRAEEAAGFYRFANQRRVGRE